MIKGSSDFGTLSVDSVSASLATSNAHGPEAQHHVHAAHDFLLLAQTCVATFDPAASPQISTSLCLHALHPTER